MKRIVTWLTVAALCLAMVYVPAAAANEVCFTAVNDRLLPLSADTMPIWINGVLYVPATIFDNNITGISLGLYCSQSKNGNTVTLYNLRQMLVFDINAGNSRNQHTGELYPDRAINRSNQVFLPLVAVCDFFHLDYSYSYMQYGVLVRVKNEYVALSDDKFIDAAGVLMNTYLKEYMQTQPGQDPGVVNPPDPPKPPTPGQTDVQVCLAFHSLSEEEKVLVLDRLDQADCQALFFLSQKELIQQDDLVRRIVGSGHYIGLQVDGITAQGSSETLTECNRILAHAVRTAATVVLAPDHQRAALEEDGWVCWDDAIDILPEESRRAQEYAALLAQSIESREDVVFLTFNPDVHLSEFLDEFLGQLEKRQIAVIPPLETII